MADSLIINLHNNWGHTLGGQGILLHLNGFSKTYKMSMAWTVGLVEKEMVLKWVNFIIEI